MTRIGIGFVILGLFLAGCENNGRGNSAMPADAEGEPLAVKVNPYQGPAGGERGDMTSPVGTAALEEGGQINAVFPSTDQTHHR